MSDIWFLWFPLTTLLGLALAFDIATRRIPNWLVLAGLLGGFACSLLATPATGLASFPGASGPTASLLGALTGLATLFPLYLLRAMGAGDVKLMAAVGAFLGPVPVLGAALLTFVAGGVLSLVAAISTRSLGRVLGNLRLMGMVAVSGRDVGLSLRDVQTTGRLPYAIAIAIGSGLQLWLAGREGWAFV